MRLGLLGITVASQPAPSIPSKIKTPGGRGFRGTASGRTLRMKIGREEWKKLNSK